MSAGPPRGIYRYMRLRAAYFAVPGILMVLFLSPGMADAQSAGPKTPQEAHSRDDAQSSAQAKEPDGSIAMPPSRAADSYAIYSLLMPGSLISSLSSESGSRWAIAEVTVNAADRNPAVPPHGQLKPPADNPRGFREAVADYEANRNVRVRLNRKDFALNHPFLLLSSDEINAVRARKPEDIPGITFFSEVYFDAKHTAALVYMNSWCANLCAAGTWVYLEKRNGHWVRQSGIVVSGS